MIHRQSPRAVPLVVKHFFCSPFLLCNFIILVFNIKYSKQSKNLPGKGEIRKIVCVCGVGFKGGGIGHLMYIHHIENLGIYFLFDI